jgi:NAD(P)-dependent dehydrogenase (short-subunit alcohol dehydrogenase family)
MIDTTQSLTFFLVLLVALFFTGGWLSVTLSFCVAFAASYAVRRVRNRGGGVERRGKAVLITGCSSGIGRQHALDMLAHGPHVFAGIRKTADAEALRKAASAIGKESAALLTCVQLDVCKQDEVADAVRTVTAKLDELKAELYGVVNNAGLSYSGPLEMIPLQTLRRQFDVNVVGVVAVSQAFLPLLRRGNTNSKERRRLVMVGSSVGNFVLAGIAPYCASKYAIEAITDGFRMELQSWNIAVSNIQPGAIDTGFASQAKATRATVLADMKTKGDAPLCGKAVADFYAAAMDKDSNSDSKRGGAELTTRAINAALFGNTTNNVAYYSVAR